MKYKSSEITVEYRFVKDGVPDYIETDLKAKKPRGLPKDFEVVYKATLPTGALALNSDLEEVKRIVDQQSDEN